MPEIHVLTGAYALDALDDLERRNFERHLATCDGCRLEVMEFHESAASLAERVAFAPPPELRDRVLAEVHRTRQVSPRSRSLRSFSLRRTLAAAAVVLIVGAGAALGGITWQSQRAADDAVAESARIARVMTSPGRVEVVGSPTVGGRATVVAANGSAVFATDQLPTAPKGKTYQLWVINGAVIRSAGLLKLSDGTGQALISGVPNGASVAVSVEPDGGSKQPTTTPVLNLPVIA